MNNLLDIFNNPNNFKDLLYTNGYLVYRIYNTITKKSYIGDTKDNLYERFFKIWDGGHFGRFLDGTPSHLYNSMRKYGLNKFELSILYRGPFNYDLEKSFITKYDSYHNGYNNTPDGKGVTGEYYGRWVNDGIREWKLPYELPCPDGVAEGRLSYAPRLNCTLFYDETGKEIVVQNENIDQYKIDHPTHVQGRLTPWVNDTTWVTDGKVDRRINNNDVEQFLLDNPEFRYGMAVGHTLGKVPMWIASSNKFTLVDEDLVDEFIKDNPGSYRKSPNEGRVNITNGSINYSLYKDEAEEFIRNNPEYYYGRSYSTTSGKRWVNNGVIRKYINSEELDQFLLNNPEFHIGFSL